MSKINAFGVAVFGPNQQSKKPIVIIGEINQKLETLGIDADQIINIQVEQEFYHVFYKE